jgi:NADH-quinone oxidoreductase subunit L
MTFFSKKRWADDVHPHESPAVMTIPLIVLAALSVLGGIMLAGNWIVDFLSPVVGHVEHVEPPIPAILITLIIVLIVAAGAALAVLLFQQRDVPRVAPTDVSFVTRAARADLYGDDINDTLVTRPGGHLVNGLVATDRGVVDGAFMGGALTVAGIGQGLRRLQTGYVRSYALSVLGGALLLVLTLVAVNL